MPQLDNFILFDGSLTALFSFFFIHFLVILTLIPCWCRVKSLLSVATMKVLVNKTLKCLLWA